MKYLFMYLYIIFRNLLSLDLFVKFTFLIVLPDLFVVVTRNVNLQFVRPDGRAINSS